MRVTSTAAFSFHRFLVTGFFVEIRELVSTQQNFTTLCHCFMTSFIAFVYCSLNRTSF